MRPGGPGSSGRRSGAPAAAAPAGDTIKLGGGFALTGDESVLDLPAANGARLAAKEINAAGGVLGKQLDFIVHDSQYKMDVTAQTAKQFVEEDKVIGLVGYTDTDSVLASGPTIQKAGLPFITAGATSPKIPAQVGDMMFLAAFGDNVQAAAGAEFGMKNFGKNAYLLSDKGVEYTTLLGQYFKQAFTDLGGTVALEDTYDDDATDFSAQIAKVKALPQQPDFYYVAAMPYNVGTVVKQFRDAGITGPIIGGDGYDDPSWIAAAGAAANDVYFTTHALNDPEAGTDAYKKFYRGLPGGIRPRAGERLRRPGLRQRLSVRGCPEPRRLDRRPGHQEGAGRDQGLPRHHRRHHLHGRPARAAEGCDRHRAQGRQVHAGRRDRAGEDSRAVTRFWTGYP